MSARYGFFGEIDQASHRKTYPRRFASCVPMGCLAALMEFLRPTGGIQNPTATLADYLGKYIVTDCSKRLPLREYQFARDNFCDPQSPWQRETNENTNRLLRQYFPKKTNLSIHSQSELNKVALKLNQRPRKILGYQTPADKLQASVAVIG